MCMIKIREKKINFISLSYQFALIKLFQCYTGTIQLAVIQSYLLFSSLDLADENYFHHHHHYYYADHKGFHSVILRLIILIIQSICIGSTLTLTWFMYFDSHSHVNDVKCKLISSFDQINTQIVQLSTPATTDISFGNTKLNESELEFNSNWYKPSGKPVGRASIKRRPNISYNNMTSTSIYTTSTSTPNCLVFKIAILVEALTHSLSKVCCLGLIFLFFISTTRTSIVIVIVISVMIWLSSFVLLYYLKLYDKCESLWNICELTSTSDTSNNNNNNNNNTRTNEIKMTKTKRQTETDLARAKTIIERIERKLGEKYWIRQNEKFAKDNDKLGKSNEMVKLIAVGWHAYVSLFNWPFICLPSSFQWKTESQSENFDTVKHGHVHYELFYCIGNFIFCILTLILWTLQQSNSNFLSSLSQESNLLSRESLSSWHSQCEQLPIYILSILFLAQICSFLFHFKLLMIQNRITIGEVLSYLMNPRIRKNKDNNKMNEQQELEHEESEKEEEKRDKRKLQLQRAKAKAASAASSISSSQVFTSTSNHNGFETKECWEQISNQTPGNVNENAQKIIGAINPFKDNSLVCMREESNEITKNDDDDAHARTKVGTEADADDDDEEDNEFKIENTIQQRQQIKQCDEDEQQQLEMQHQQKHMKQQANEKDKEEKDKEQRQTKPKRINYDENNTWQSNNENDDYHHQENENENKLIELIENSNYKNDNQFKLTSFTSAESKLSTESYIDFKPITIDLDLIINQSKTIQSEEQRQIDDLHQQTDGHQQQCREQILNQTDGSNYQRDNRELKVTNSQFDNSSVTQQNRVMTEGHEFLQLRDYKKRKQNDQIWHLKKYISTSASASVSGPADLKFNNRLKCFRLFIGEKTRTRKPIEKAGCSLTGIRIPIPIQPAASSEKVSPGIWNRKNRFFDRNNPRCNRNENNNNNNNNNNGIVNGNSVNKRNTNNTVGGDVYVNCDYLSSENYFRSLTNQNSNMGVWNPMFISSSSTSTGTTSDPQISITST